MKNIKRQKNLKSQRGANLVETALLIALVSIVAIPSLINIGSKAGSNLCRGSVDERNEITYYKPNVGCMVVSSINPCYGGRNPYYNMNTNSISCTSSSNNSNGA